MTGVVKIRLSLVIKFALTKPHPDPEIGVRLPDIRQVLPHPLQPDGDVLLPCPQGAVGVNIVFHLIAPVI